jgi:uncharacterized protein
VQVRALMDQLTAGVPLEAHERSHEQHARWLLAQLLEFHRREDKSTWWDYYRLCDLPPEDYLDEPCAVDGLTLVGPVGGTARCPIHHTLSIAGAEAATSEVHYGKDLCSARRGVDLKTLTIDIKKRRVVLHPACVPLRPRAVKPIPDTPSTSPRGRRASRRG